MGLPAIRSGAGLYWHNRNILKRDMAV